MEDRVFRGQPHSQSKGGATALHNFWDPMCARTCCVTEKGKGVSNYIDIGHSDIGHTEDHIGHKQSRYRPQVDIGHTISATNV